MAILSGRTMVDKHYIEFADDLYDQNEQEQPNGVDLRIHRAYQITGQASLPNSSKMDFSGMQVREIDPKNGWFDFVPNQGSYLMDFREKVAVPETYCGIIMGRSSLLRVGALVEATLWDSNFYGRTGAALRPLNPIKIQYGARIAQMIFIKADNVSVGYGGRFQGGDSQVGLFT